MKGTFSNSRRGFTLVELVVVIAIIAILSGVGFAAYNGYIERAREAADLELLGVVNTAFASACAEKGVDGLPDKAVATLVQKKVDKITVEGVDGLNELFFDYFEGNEDKSFNVYEGLLYSKARGFYGSLDGGNQFIFADGSTLTNKGTDAAGNTTWTWEKDGEEYSITTNEEEIRKFNDSFGKNISIDGLMEEVNDVAESAAKAVTAINPVFYTMLENSLKPYLNGIDSASPEYNQALSNALVLGTANYLSGYTPEELYEAATSGSFAVKSMNDAVIGMAAGMAFKYTVLTGYANSPEGKTSTIHDPDTGEEKSIQQYLQDMTDDLANVSSGTEAMEMLDKVNQTIIATSEYQEYMAANGEADMAGLLAAMNSINNNSDAMVQSGVVESGFGDESVKDVLSAIFGG